MMCEACLEHLEAYLDDEIDGSAKKAMAGHLSECSSCQAQFSELETVRQDIAWAIENIPLPSGLENRVLVSVFSGSHILRETMLDPGHPSAWKTGILLSLVLAPLLLLLHPLSVRVLSLGYGMSRVFGRGLYVLSGAIPPVWSMGLGLAGLVVMGLGMYFIWKLVQAIPVREAAS